MNIVLLVVGLALIIVGANFLTEGATGIAKRFGISEFVIGLTIVGIGTSMPELVVSLFSAAKGSDDLAVGNVVGSNMFNTLVILGLTALFVPIPFSRDNVRKDVPIGIAASAVLILVTGSFCWDAAGSISRVEGIILCLLFALFILYSIREGKNPAEQLGAEEQPKRKKEPKQQKLWLSLLMVAAGLAGLIFGGDLFLDRAVWLARTFGVSEPIIAVTLLAGGTSLPELATSLVAALKGNVEIALGNAIGSNVANILLVLGVTATVSPLTLGQVLPADIWVVAASSVILLISAFTFRGRRINRADGAIFLLLYGGYIGWVLVR